MRKIESQFKSVVNLSDAITRISRRQFLGRDDIKRMRAALRIFAELAEFKEKLSELPIRRESKIQDIPETLKEDTPTALQTVLSRLRRNHQLPDAQTVASIQESIRELKRLRKLDERLSRLLEPRKRDKT
jgi:hypothetical protein